MAKQRIKTKKVVTVVRKARPQQRRKKPLPNLPGFGPRMSTVLNGSMSVNRLGHSLINPFDVTECIPDGARGVGCFSTKDIISLSTAALGSHVSLAYAPRIGNMFNVDTSTTTGTIIFGSWSSATAVTSIRAQYSKYRTISAGLRVSYDGPTNLDSGYIMIGLVSGNIPASTFNGLAPNAAAPFMMNYKIIPVRNGCVATWRPVEFDNMSEWFPTSEISGTSSVPIDVPYFVLAAGNCAASNGIFIVECVTNFEGQYSQQTFMPGGISVKPSVPAEPGWYERAQDIVTNAPNIIPLVGGVVQGYMESGVRGAIGAMANGLAYPHTLAASGLPQRERGVRPSRALRMLT